MALNVVPPNLRLFCRSRGQTFINEKQIATYTKARTPKSTRVSKSVATSIDIPRRYSYSEGVSGRTLTIFTQEEGEGWTQLGESVMPNSTKDAGIAMDAFQQMGERTMNSLFGSQTLPDLKEAVGVMFGPQPIELNGTLPSIELFDSSLGMESAQSLNGMEAMNMPAIENATPGGTVETLHQADASGLSEGGLDVGKAVGEIFSKIGEMLTSAMSAGPMGILGGIFQFLMAIFSQIIDGLSQAIQETARAAASLATEAWKKQMSASQGGL